VAEGIEITVEEAQRRVAARLAARFAPAAATRAVPYIARAGMAAGSTVLEVALPTLVIGGVIYGTLTSTGLAG
jgi:hypothetical protein